MIDALFNQSNYLAARRLLDVSTLRHEALAANLANVETPNYRRVEVNPAFDAELRAAIASGDTERLKSMQPQIVADTSARPIRLDGNTVDLEQELMKLNENALEHSAETQLLTGALLRLRLAITGRPS